MIDQGKVELFQAKLDQYEAVGLVTTPTPLHFLPKLSKYLDGPKIWVKRDDATHISSGGNKMRKLDRVLRKALDTGCDTLVSGGVAQSNSQRQVATAAAMLGMECHLAVYQGRVASTSSLYDVSGNIVLNHLLGANMHAVGWVGDRNSAIEALSDELCQAGKKPFMIPYGVSNAMGAISYSSVIVEIAQQCLELDFVPDVIIASSGSGGTQAGLSLGAQNCLPGTQVTCFDVDAEAERVKQDVIAYATEASERLDVAFNEDCVELFSGFAGQGYGVLAEETVEAMTLLARLEAIILDPVYTGKAMAGLIAKVQKGHYSKDSHIVFVHTGGSPATFAYADKIIEAL